MSQSFADHLRESAEETKSIVSAGYDPAPTEFPIDGISGYDDQLPNPISNYNGKEVQNTIVEYFREFAEEIDDQNISPGAFKPNLGYFDMFKNEEGYWGPEALKDVTEEMKETFDVPVILDAKDADIERSSAAYAISELNRDNIDAMTIHGWMGDDSAEPFFEFADQNDQGVYVLTRTTNPGAEDFQERQAGPKKNYEHMADKVVEWSQSYPGTVGSVVAGNNIDELESVVSQLAEEGEEVSMLLPGIGTQGGEADDVMDVMLENNYDPRLARINSSSGIMYRAQKDGRPRDEHAEASAQQLSDMNEDINLAKVLE